MFLESLVLLLGGGILPVFIFSTSELVGVRGLSVDGLPAKASSSHDREGETAAACAEEPDCPTTDSQCPSTEAPVWSEIS